MKTYRVGIIGCGTIFPMHAQSLKKVRGVKLAAVCDIKRKKATEQARIYNCNFYLDYKQMIEKESLDSIHICTPHHLHAPMAIYAAKRKVNILVEKPMTLNPKEAKRVIEFAKKYRVKLGVISQNRFNPGSRLVKDSLTSGQLGKFICAKLILSYHKPDSYYNKSDWKGTWDKEGGGVTIDQSIHFLDTLRWFADDEIEYIDANIHNRMHEVVDVEDCAEGIIKFKKGTYVCFYLINYYSYDADVEIEMHCKKGRIKIVKDSAYIDFLNGSKKKAEPRSDEYIDYGDGVKDYWGFCHYNQIKEYYDALRHGRDPAANGLDGLKSLEIVCGIYESSKKKKRIYF